MKKSQVSFEPMLAMLDNEAPLNGEDLLFEPKYDGVRAVIYARHPGESHEPVVELRSRQGNDKAAQFPEIAEAVADLCARRQTGFVLDGEIVAVERSGEFLRFGDLAPRMHLQRKTDIAQQRRIRPVTLVVFDLLQVGAKNTGTSPLCERRQMLETLFDGHADNRLQLGRQVAKDGRGLWDEAEKNDWEGILVKDARSLYSAGARSEAWRKRKRLRAETFVVCGFTKPRGSRPGIGALLLGERNAAGDFTFVGGVGTGFSIRDLEQLEKLLSSQTTGHCPFKEVPQTPTQATWVTTDLEATVVFAERTTDGMLRHPVFKKIGRLRVDPHKRSAGPHEEPTYRIPNELLTVIETLNRIENGAGNGTLILPDGMSLDVTNLGKIFWPQLGLTKGDLLRHYVTVAPLLLPALAGRPLVMQRFPHGVDDREAFYQHRAPDKLPRGVRVAAIAKDDVPARLIGGTLGTLLYMVQLGAFSQDPWFSRATAPEEAVEVAFDLDPMPGVAFERVTDVALWIRDELETVGVQGFPKTSGSTGIHIFVPLSEGTSFEAARLFTQIVSTLVARKHGAVATVERMISARGDKVYIDFLQNIRGKTLASVYSARANAFAGVSTPVSFEELAAGVRPEDFTIRSLPRRLESTGDLWAEVRGSRRVDLRVVLERLQKRFTAVS